MTEFREQSFGDLRFKEEKGAAYRDLTLDDLLGSQEASIECNTPLELLAERERAVAEAEARAAKLLMALESGVRKLSSEESRLWAEGRRAAIALGFAVAERVLGVSLATNSEVMEKAIERLLDRMEGDGRAVLMMNPMDADRLRAAREAAGECWPPKDSVRIGADSAIAPGSAALELETHRVEIDYRRQLEELREIVEIEEERQSADAAYSAEAGSDEGAGTDVADGSQSDR